MNLSNRIRVIEFLGIVYFDIKGFFLSTLYVEIYYSLFKQTLTLVMLVYLMKS